MQQLKRYYIIGAIFVLIFGTVSHFLYEWTDNHFIVGLFVPVNESTWEHMKLLFFPMLLYSLFVALRFRKDIYLAASFASGILLGTFLIPVIFYTYTGIIGHHIFILDLFTFALCVIAAFYTAYRRALSCTVQKYRILLYVLLFVTFLCFLSFTYFPPGIGLFAIPQG